MILYMLDIIGGLDFGTFEVVGVMGEKEKEFQRLHDAIGPYIAENLQHYITQPPIQSRGDWGQSQFQLGGDDESTHQILSYGLLFSTFYHFPYTTDPDIHRTDVTFPDHCVNLRAITTDYTLYPSHHRSGTMLETSHMTYRPCRYIFLS